MRRAIPNFDVSTLTIQQATELYEAHWGSLNLAEKTQQGYRDALKLWMEWLGKDKHMLVNSLTINHVTDFIAKQRRRQGRVEGTQFSSHSLHKYFSVLRTFIRWMYRQGYMELPMDFEYEAPRVSKDLPDPLSPAEQVQLFRNLRTENHLRNQCIFEFLIDTGVRLEELVNLELGDLHVEDGYTMIRQGKGAKDRMVYMGATLCAHLSEYVRLGRRPKFSGEKHLWIDDKPPRIGLPMGYEGMASLIRRRLEAVREGGKCGAHTLRHTFATNYLRNGGSLLGLQRLLGHNDIKVTQRYVHLVNNDVRDEHLRVSPLDNLRY